MEKQETKPLSTKRKINKKKITIFSIIVALLFIYIIYAIFMLIANPTDVIMVEKGKLYSEENTTGYIIRNETVVKGKNYKNGIVPIKNEGEKVSKDDQIFRYYSNNEEELVKKIEELDLKIQEVMKNENIFPNDIKLIDNKIDEILVKTRKLNNIGEIKEQKKEISELVTKKARIAGEQSPAGSYTRQLIQQRSSYETQLNTGSEYIIAPKSGIVSYRVDGLEDILTIEDIDGLTPKSLRNINVRTGQMVSSNKESGKIIDNFECYIASIINSDLAKENAKVGKKVTIRLSSQEETVATIEKIIEKDNERIVIFKINNLVEKLINYRKISFDVIWWSDEGLKVPNSAIITRGDLNYIVRNRAGYTDEVLIKVVRKNEKYSIIENYTATELKTMEEVKASKTISIYDEILLYP